MNTFPESALSQWGVEGGMGMVGERKQGHRESEECKECKYIGVLGV